MSTISIITPFKDAAPFLKDCIDSICRQSHDSWQLIAIDDHSEDHSRAIIESYKDPRIEILTNNGKGILSALQTAQEHIKGNYVTRMDADDIMPDNKLKVLLEVLYASTSKTIATGLVKYFSEGEVSEGYLNYECWLNDTAQQGLFYERIYRECVVASPNWLMHRMDFDAIGGFQKLNYPEDYDMVFRWRAAGLKIKSAHTLTHLWREHPNRTSRNSDVYQQESFFRLKLPYFIEEFKNRRIQLIGAKKKGKLIAQILKEHHCSFDWYEKDPALIGQTLINTEIKSIDFLKTEEACILSVYPDEELRTALEAFISKRGYYIGANAHYF